MFNSLSGCRQKILKVSIAYSSYYINIGICCQGVKLFA